MTAGYDLMPTSELLGQEAILAGDTRKVRLYLDAILDPGVVGASITATDDSANSVVASATLSDDKRSAWFLVTASALDTRFTVTLRVTLSDGQSLGYKIIYNVMAPST